MFFSLHCAVIQNILFYKKNLNGFLRLCTTDYLLRNKTTFWVPISSVFSLRHYLSPLHEACPSKFYTISTYKNHLLIQHQSQTFLSYLLSQIILSNLITNLQCKQTKICSRVYSQILKELVVTMQFTTFMWYFFSWYTYVVHLKRSVYFFSWQLPSS